MLITRENARRKPDPPVTNSYGSYTFVDKNSPTFHLQIHGEETGLSRTMNYINVTLSYARCFHGVSLS